MLTAQDALLVVVGIIACFTGYSMFRSMLPMWGFILGGWIVFILFPGIVGPAVSANLLILIGAVVVGGLIGAAIAVPLYFVIIFLSGAALGMLLGVMVGALIDVGGITSMQQINRFAAMSFPPFPQTGTQWILMIVFGIVLGGMTISFQKFMISASSAFLGSAALITGLMGSFSLLSATDMGRSATAIAGWIILGLVGLFVQFRMMGEV